MQDNFTSSIMADKPPSHIPGIDLELEKRLQTMGFKMVIFI